MRLLKLNPQHHDVLKAIHDYITEFGSPPYRKNHWICTQTNLSSNYVTNIKRELKDMKYLTEELELTKNGEEYIRTYFGQFTVQGVEVRLQGWVKASPGDDILVDYNTFDTPSDKTITIPNVSLDKDVFALKVTGPSMKQVGIFDGDYVIVEKKDSSSWWPNPQDIIVAKYLPHNPDRSLDEDVDPDEYLGPVVKVYLQRFGERGCELGWRKENETNPYKIKADSLIPIGKINGVYREITTLF